MQGFVLPKLRDVNELIEKEHKRRVKERNQILFEQYGLMLPQVYTDTGF